MALDATMTFCPAFRLRLTVHDVRSREACDVEIGASSDTPLSAVLGALPVPTAGRACFVGATELDPRAPLAASPLLPGAVLSVGGPGPDYVFDNALSAKGWLK